ncbi:hypothetical protein B0T17DRAFT_552518, partial [Bombardia bombarda]
IKSHLHRNQDHLKVVGSTPTSGSIPGIAFSLWTFFCRHHQSLLPSNNERFPFVDILLFLAQPDYTSIILVLLFVIASFSPALHDTKTIREDWQ